MKEREVSATDFKRHCLRWVGLVERTRLPICVTRRGKVVARVVPSDESPPDSLVGSVRYDNEDDLLAPIDDVWESEQ